MAGIRSGGRDNMESATLGSADAVCHKLLGQINRIAAAVEALVVLKLVGMGAYRLVQVVAPGRLIEIDCAIYHRFHSRILSPLPSVNSPKAMNSASTMAQTPVTAKPMSVRSRSSMTTPVPVLPT